MITQGKPAANTCARKIELRVGDEWVPEHVIKLEKGDVFRIRHDDGTLYTDSTGCTEFCVTEGWEQVFEQTPEPLPLTLTVRYDFAATGKAA